jgi:hypothetical protein
MQLQQQFALCPQIDLFYAITIHFRMHQSQMHHLVII